MIRHIVSQRDFSRILDAPRDLRMKLILRLLHDLGLRTTELMSIKIEDVDLENKSIQIVDSKKHIPFSLPLTSKCCELLTEYINGRVHEWLFPSSYMTEKNRHLGDNWLQVQIKKLACQLDLNNWNRWSPRTFRRRLARFWVIKKGSLTGLQDILRHNRVSTTSIYCDGIRFLEEDTRAEYDRIMNYA